MATYTIDTSAAEERGLSYVVGKLNDARASMIPPKPPLSNADYVDQMLVRAALLEFNRARKAEDSATVGAAYDAATNSVQNQVKALLGL